MTKQNKINRLIEYSSPALILSYFFIHKILLVLIGIIFSLYLINAETINSIFIFITNNLSIIKSSNNFDNSEKKLKNNFTTLKVHTEDSEPTLAERIEELGFIPSKDKNKDVNAA